MVISQQTKDEIKKISVGHDITEAELLAFYEKHDSDPANSEMPPAEKELYIMCLLNGFIGDFVNKQIMTYEVIAVYSSQLITTKKQTKFQTHTFLGKKIKDAQGKPVTGSPEVWISLMCGADATLPVYEFGETGEICLDIKEDGAIVKANSVSETSLIKRPISWAPNPTEKLNKIFGDPVTILNAGSMVAVPISADNPNVFNPSSIRKITAMIHSAFSIDKAKGDKKDEVKVSSSSVIASLVDASIAQDTDFIKTKLIPDPERPGQTKKIYGGFSAFLDGNILDKYNAGPKTLGTFYGYITSAKSMNVIYFKPIKIQNRTSKLNSPPPESAPTTPAAHVEAPANLGTEPGIIRPSDL